MNRYVDRRTHTRTHTHKKIDSFWPVIILAQFSGKWFNSVKSVPFSSFLSLVRPMPRTMQTDSWLLYRLMWAISKLNCYTGAQPAHYHQFKLWRRSLRASTPLFESPESWNCYHSVYCVMSPYLSQKGECGVGPKKIRNNSSYSQVSVKMSPKCNHNMVHDSP